MVASNHDMDADGSPRRCYYCVAESMVPSNQAVIDTDFFCKRHFSLHGQYTLQGPSGYLHEDIGAGDDVELHASLAPLSISGLSESSSDSHDTLKAATDIIRPDLSHILGQDYSAVSEPSRLTENAMRALEIISTQTYPSNTYEWLYDSNNYNLPPNTNTDLPHISDSMLVSKPAKRSISSTNTSSWYLVERPSEESSHGTDQFVIAAGAQYENDSAYYHTMDDPFLLEH